MTNQTQITATIESIPFADLYVSDLNPRSVVSESAIEALAENIRRVGLIQNLGGLRDADGTRVGVVAGGRRLRALALLQDDARFQTVAVQIAPDTETAQLWATSENGQREALHPADEIRDYGAMAARGVNVADIAVAYGATEKHVYRRLALANLPAPVLDALKDGKISLSHAAAFTVGNDEALTLTVLARVIEEAQSRWGGLTEHQIKGMLRPNAVGGKDRRAIFVGVEDYTAAGGRIGGDLFADETLFDDPEILDTVFAEKLARLTETAAKDGGWKWAETHGEDYLPYGFLEDRKFGRLYPASGDLTEEEAERYDALADLANGDLLDEDGEAELATLQAQADGSYSDEQKAHAGVIVYVRRDGTVEAIEGLVKKEDRKGAEEAGVLAPSHHAGGKDDGPKDPISAKLRDDLTRSARAARQDALLDDPKLALHLLAYSLSGKAGYGRVFGLRTEPVEATPSTEDGLTRDTRLAKIETPSPAYWERPEAQDFAAFRKRGDKRIMELLHRHLCAILDTSTTDLVAQIDRLTGMDVRATWTPTAENFFGRVGAAYLTDLWADLLGVAADHPTVTTFAKLKKKEKAEKLADLFASVETRSAHGMTEAQETRIAAWTPDGMV